MNLSTSEVSTHRKSPTKGDKQKPQKFSFPSGVTQRQGSAVSGERFRRDFVHNKGPWGRMGSLEGHNPHGPSHVRALKRFDPLCRDRGVRGLPLVFNTFPVSLEIVK